MKTVRLAFVLLAAALFGSGANPLNVLRVSPADAADPRTEITVTFDRPVSGGVDAQVDPAGIFRIEPAVAGRLEWRDPVTLRFVPASPLEPGASYVVTVADNFAAMDGAKLRAPYRFTVRISPARALAGAPIGGWAKPMFVAPRPVLRVLYSAAVDPARIADGSWISMAAGCGVSGRIPVESLGIRRLVEEDAPELRYTGGYFSAADSARDLRRVVELRPASALPRSCEGTLNVPQEAVAGAPVTSWPFRTYGPLAVDSVSCARGDSCPTGPIRLVFTTPVHGGDVLRHVRVAGTDFTIADTSRVSHAWVLEARLQPRQRYTVSVDARLTDVFDQRIAAAETRAITTTSYAPTVTYDHGRLLVEREGARTIAVQVVNVDTLIITTVRVPSSAEAEFLSQTRRWAAPFDRLAVRAVERRIPVTAERDHPQIVGVPVGGGGSARPGDGTLLAVRIRHAGQKPADAAVALLQVTDLAVHGRLGLEEGVVWVTGVGDGKPRAGASVTVYDATGQVRSRATTDAQGLARLPDLRPGNTVTDCEDECSPGFDGYVAAVLGSDRAVVGLNAWDPDLASWNFGVWSAWSPAQRMPAAAALFTERGIYRPGEPVYAKAIVRRGTLGSLSAPRGDSLRWEFLDREYNVARDTVTALSTFGTADLVVPVPGDAALGLYSMRLGLKHAGEWQVLAETSYEVAEYRPPEFLVDVNADASPRFAGDTVSASISARYLFGAPMAGARVRWVVQHRPMSGWELSIPNADGWEIGGYGFDESYYQQEATVATERVDSLDATGALDVHVPMPTPDNGRAARTGVIAVVTDANRQTVSAGRTIIVHPAAFYIGAKTRGSGYFWRAGTPVEIDVVALRPDGERVSGADVRGVVVRREWHRARRIRNGQLSEVGGWVTDTVGTCAVRTAAEPVGCRFTPPSGGSYTVEFTARDAQQREARTSMSRWASGAGFVPWRDDTKLRMDIIADRPRYSVGDTATLLIASPFTDVEGWLTIEREGVLESRRIHIASGATTVRVPITESLAPNAFVSVLLVRGRSAEPGSIDDPGRPAMRVGYTELRVLPEVKRLNVQLSTALPEYRPGDTARVNIAVTAPDGAGQRSEVTLWAVDEGVLALTGYQTPDPVDLLYRARPLGVRLASNLTAVAAQVPEGQKGARSAGGGGGMDVGGILRSRFQTTAFFLGSVVTDANGRVTASAALPDNLTTFRIMAVAVTAGDRYGSGSTSMLVTRPLVARAALPRFVREGDRFSAGVVVNQRTAGDQRVDVEATARGITLNGSRRKRETLRGAAAREVLFDFEAQGGDSAHFEFSARGRESADAVAVRLPVRPAYHPLARTIAGVVRDTATAVFALDPDTDPSRSTLEISFGSSTLAVVRGAMRTLRVYPYYCTEQVSSMALPLIALYRAQQQHGGSIAPPTAENDIRGAVRTITRRQNPDGGIGYWSPNDWSTPWLTSYAARVLLEARDAGFAVDSLVLNRLADYLSRSLNQPLAQQQFAVARWSEVPHIELSERVAAADMLSRLGRADVPLENSLFARAGQLAWEDRVLLAEVLARRGAASQARTLLSSAWQGVTPNGRTLSLPAAPERHYFSSSARPAARLLTATLALEPQHPQLKPLVETLVQHGRATARSWNTQDYGSAVLALMAYERHRTGSAGGSIRIDGPRGTLLTRTLGAGEARDTSMAISGITRDGTLQLHVTTDADAPVYYYLTVREVPRARPVRPVDNGITVERWYERADDRTPVTRVAAGELVRVRLRITVPADRQFVVLDDPLPAGLEAVDLSLRTVRPPGMQLPEDRDDSTGEENGWHYGSWDSGVWSVFDHKELRDDRVVYFATYLWQGTHTATYLARATTAGTFAMPPAHAEEMYNPAVNGRTGGGHFVVTPARR